MLPFVNSLENGETYLDNTIITWGGRESLVLKDLIKLNHRIPFVLFSSVIICNKNSNKDDILEDIKDRFYNNNDFLQIPLFIQMISVGDVLFYDAPLQEYKSPSYVRFTLNNMVDSMEQVIDFIENYYTISAKTFYRSNYSRWMHWLLIRVNLFYLANKLSTQRVLC